MKDAVYSLSLSLSSLLLSLSPPDLAVCPTFNMTHGDYVISHNTSERWMENTQLDITCDHGYRVADGSVTVTCSGEGRWVPQSPECLREFDIKL